MTGGSAAVAAFLAAAIAAGLPCDCFGHTVRFGSLEISHPVIVTPQPGQTASCVRITIRNLGSTEEVLTGARIEEAVEVVPAHTTWPLRIRPGETLELRKGCFIRVIGIGVLPEPDMGLVPGVLIFQSAGPVPVEFMVDPPE